MKIELKNVQHAKFASHETECFTATVYIDGVKRGTVENDGHGACHLYHPHQIEIELNEYAKTLPQYEAFGMMLTHDADSLIDEAFYTVVHTKDLKRLLKCDLLFWDASKKVIRRFKCNNESQKWAYITTAKTNGVDSISTIGKSDVSGCVLLNALPFADALEIYRQL